MTEPTSAAVTPPVVTPPAAVTPPVQADPAPWYPDTAKDYVANKGWKTPHDVLGGYQALETLFGADKAGRTIVMPKDDKDVEGLKAFRTKLGVPESADKYELPLPAGQGDELSKAAASWFHEAGIPKTAAQAITTKWNAHIEALVKAEQTKAQTESEVQLQTLKGEWGVEFDQKAEFARRFLKAAGWDDAKMAKYEQAFGTATMLKDFFQWGSKVGEPGFVSGDKGGGFTPGKEAIAAQIKALRDDRIAGRVTEKEFHAKMALLGPQSEAA